MKKNCRLVQRGIHAVSAALLAALLLAACAIPKDKPEEKTGSYSNAAAEGAEQEVQAVESLYTQEPENAEGGEADGGEEAVTLPKGDHSGRYCYDTLSEEEQAWYADMYEIMDGMYTGAALSPQGYGTVAEQEIDRIFQCVMMDHPELFFVKGYRYTTYTRNEEIVKISFEGDYTMSAAERKQNQELIDAAVEVCLAGISSEASEYEKVKYIYEYLVLHTDYNQNICSVFVGGESVCQGYAKAAQYLFDKLGIASTLVVGTVSDGQRHAWNLVWVDGESYYLDVTWGDASYRAYDEEENELPAPPINYDYLCVTTKELLQTHEPDDFVPLPECTATAANYYVMEGACFDSYEEEALTAFFENASLEERVTVTLKCTDEEVYAAFFERLIENQEIFRYLDSGGGPITYTAAPDRLSLTFWLVNE